MELLLDTHIAIWALDNSPSLPKEFKEMILDTENNIYFSAISVMEVSIKHQKRPDIMPRNGTDFYEECLEAGYYTMPFKPKHAIAFDNLYNEKHFDPFDKALIAQAKMGRMMLLSHDEKLKYYNEPCVIYI